MMVESKEFRKLLEELYDAYERRDKENRAINYRITEMANATQRNEEGRKYVRERQTEIDILEGRLRQLVLKETA